jgi:hypothetical protein
MKAELAIAGVLCVAMGLGHASIGWRWILPSLTEERVPRTPFGPPAMSVSMLRVTWYIVTVFAVGMGGLLLTLAFDSGADPMTQVLRWLAGMWLVATAMAAWLAGIRVRKLRGLLRLPVPLVWLVVAYLCWAASS